MAEEKILVVDDEETLCEALQFNLEVEAIPWMWHTVPSRLWRCL